MNRIYLDYNASTPIALEVQGAMLPFLQEHYGNPSALHFAGIQAKSAVEKARKQVADLLHCSSSEIIFTSGGSEANNHVLKSVFQSQKGKGKHIITTKIEHPAILNPCRYLEQQGAKVTYVDVDRYGRVDPAAIENAITDETILITVMHSNNEVGTIQPIEEIGKIAKKHAILFHTDASQSVGKVPIDVTRLHVDFLTVAGHKLYAPKGIGALYIKEGIEIEPLIHGAGHENGRRAGTENVLFTVALGEACEIATTNTLELIESTKILRDYFWKQLSQLSNVSVSLNGHPDYRLPNTLNVNFENRIGQDILDALPDLAASTGSACHAGEVTLSPVLKAMSVPESVGKGAIRFSLGRYTTKDELDTVVQCLDSYLNSN
ncbi:cysteine desulfurase [Aquibacillus koreensis]|uniref:cysteine desulfurase n=1 Tax=Aquibacillus koreensis TaxID=279446 RepID=A0A9X3WKQ8_9BACI|nr:cysteine desulfurase family protein [Aquibacillus koreensis]MCT2536009.1 cysteine desulfurase [Aquibacillus koreensis]MDC3420465.1 cysteine desulfurase [Aquibacillus koreensis]